MFAKASKPPTTQRRFASAWSELDYLCKKIHYWLYTRKQRQRAERYVRRLERVLGELPENDLAIVRAEGWALLCELRGETTDAIAHREREIQLTERLHREAAVPGVAATTRKFMLRGRDRGTLSERRAILRRLKSDAAP